MHIAGVCIRDRALTFSGINGHIVILSEELPVTFSPVCATEQLINWNGPGICSGEQKQAHSKLFIGQMETVIYSQAMANLLPRD